jgi:hypothetical protein
MNPISSVVKMHFRFKMTWFMLPWIIVGSSFIVNYIISYFVDEMETGGLASFYIYGFVAGIVVLSQTFPFALGFSARRTDFFLGTALTVIIASAVNALVLVLLSVMESSWIENWGTNLHFFHLAYWSDGSVSAQLWISFVTLLQLFFLGFVIASVHRRFGKTGTYSFFLGISLLFTILSFICTSNNWWVDIGNWLVDQSAFDYSLWMLPLIAGYGLVSFLLLRRATV